MKTAFGESVGLADALFDGVGSVEERIRNVQSAEERLGDVASLSLPRVALAKGAAIADEHQERNFVEMGEGDDAVDGGEEAVVLHEHGGFDAGEMRAGGEANAFFFLGETDESHLWIVFSDVDQVDEPGFRKSGKQLDAARFERAVDELRIFERDGHVSWKCCTRTFARMEILGN